MTPHYKFFLFSIWCVWPLFWLWLPGLWYGRRHSQHSIWMFGILQQVSFSMFYCFLMFGALNISVKYYIYHFYFLCKCSTFLLKFFLCISSMKSTNNYLSSRYTHLHVFTLKINASSISYEGFSHCACFLEYSLDIDFNNVWGSSQVTYRHVSKYSTKRR